MLHRIAAFVVLVFLLAAARLPARADKPLAAKVANADGAPIRVLSCSAKLADTDQGMYLNFYIRAQAQLENVTAKRIIAVKMLFTVRNAFDEELDKAQLTDDVEIASGESNGAVFEWTKLYDATHTIVCAPLMVKFSDGTAWTNDFKPQHKRIIRRAATPAPVARRRSATPAPARPHPVQHPSTCRVTLADGRSIDIPWNNAGCTPVRTVPSHQPVPSPAASAPLASPQPASSAGSVRAVSIDYEAIGPNGHPATCIVVDGGRSHTSPWESDECEHARETWAVVPQYMRENLWDRHDGAAENLDNGHPKFCTPAASKSFHVIWQSYLCKNARLKWATIHPG